MSDPIFIRGLRSFRSLAGIHQVEADVGGSLAWMKSSHPMRASAEGFAAAFLFSAMAAQRDLKVEGGLDPQFTANVARIQDIAVDWWPHLAKIALNADVLRPSGVGAGAAMFFTGGVDSFFTLHRNLGTIARLVNVHGFDIKLSDAARIEQSIVLLDGVGRELGKDVVYVATNLRDHPIFGGMNWELTHISALSAVAHSLVPRLSKVLVASSDVPPPWGSNEELDPLWSTSALSIVNDGWQFSRLAKVRSIAEWDIVRRCVKVCWENRAATLNCGVCEKCVRTQAQFLAAGADEPLPAFPTGDLARRVDALPKPSTALRNQWLEIREAMPDGANARAVDRYLERGNAGI